MAREYTSALRVGRLSDGRMILLPLLGVLFGAGFTRVAWPAQPPAAVVPDVIRAHRFELVDDEGKVRIDMRADASGTDLILRAPSATKAEVSLHVDKDRCDLRMEQGDGLTFADLDSASLDFLDKNPYCSAHYNLAGASVNRGPANADTLASVETAVLRPGLLKLYGGGDDVSLNPRALWMEDEHGHRRVDLSSQFGLFLTGDDGKETSMPAPHDPK